MAQIANIFQLRFPDDQLKSWASKYDYTASGLDDAPKEAGQFMADNGFLSESLFLNLCRWKSQRTHHHCIKNDEAFIREVTGIALSTADERLRIEVLTLLTGVSWPTASVILHFGYREEYPILDRRALWSLGIDNPPGYKFEFWWSYVRFCRGVAQQQQVTMRELDKALWKYSQVKQE